MVIVIFNVNVLIESYRGEVSASKKNWLLSCVIKIIQSLGEENVSATLPILRCCFGWFDGPESPQAQYLVCDDFKLEGCLILPPCSYMFSKQKQAVYSN